MGWRFRKSIGGKYFRVNLGKKGVSSFTLGKRGMPHVTVGKSGTTIGAGIPGTGAYYTKKIGRNRQHETTQFLNIPENSQELEQQIPLQVSPPGHNSLNNFGEKSPVPWSKLVLVSMSCAIFSFPFAFFTHTASFSLLLTITALILASAGLIVILRKRKRRSVFLAVVAILLSFIVGMIASGHVEGQSGNTTTTTSGLPSHNNSQSAKAKASESAEAKKSQDVAQAELDSAKESLSSKIVEAESILTSSQDNVADPNTRQLLSDAINKATTMQSTNPEDYSQEVSQLQSTMDSVTTSIEQKKTNDENARKANEDALQQAQAQPQQQPTQPQPAPQQQQQQNPPSQGITGYCKDGTPASGNPSARGKANSCYGHGGWQR